MTPEQEQKIIEESTSLFTKVQTVALRTGAQMICSAVLDMANQDIPCDKKFDAIVQFCKDMLGKNETN